MTSLRRPNMNRSRTRACVLALACVATVAACDDPLTVDDFAGEYDLVSIGGASLPFKTVTAADTQYLWTERLTIGRDSRARTVLTAEMRRQDGSVTPFTSVVDYATGVRDDHLVMLFICPSNANCTEPRPINVYREGDGLRVEDRGLGGAWRYGRASVYRLN